MGAETPIVTRSDKHACAVRELNKRRSAYPRWVSAGKMTMATATREIMVMEAIVKDYEPERLL